MHSGHVTYIGAAFRVHTIYFCISFSLCAQSVTHSNNKGGTLCPQNIYKTNFRCSLSYEQDDCIKVLLLVEFTYNNTLHDSNGVTPFFGNYGFHPRFSSSIPGNYVNPSAEACARTLADIHQDLSLELILVGDQYKAQVDHHRSTTSAFVVGDQVWLLRCHVDITRPCAKLGPFRISPIIF